MTSVGTNFDDQLATASLCIDDIFRLKHEGWSVVCQFALKILDNIRKNPKEQKFRKVNWQKVQKIINKKLNNDYTAYPLLEAFLRSCGFESIQDPYIQLSDKNLTLAETAAALIREKFEEKNRQIEKERQEILERNRRLIEENTRDVRKKMERKKKFKKNIMDKQQKEQQDNIKNRVYVPSTDKLADRKFGRTDVKVEFKTGGGG